VFIGLVVGAAFLASNSWSYYAGGSHPHDGRYPGNCYASADGSACCYGGHDQALIQACEDVMASNYSLEQLCSATPEGQKAAAVRLAGG
jgi:hypothetical protein